MTHPALSFLKVGMSVVLLGLLTSGPTDRSDTAAVIEGRSGSSGTGSADGTAGPATGASEPRARGPRPETSGPLFRATLSIDDVIPALPTGEEGSDWSDFDLSEVPSDDFVRIGGEIGVGNVPGTVRRKVERAYEQEAPDEETSGYVSNTILVMGDEVEALDAVSAFRAAAETTSWRQEFSDSVDTYRLTPLAFDDIGDETFAVRLDITTRQDRPFSDETTDRVDYVVFRIGPAISFVFARGADPSALARRSAEKVRELLED